MRLLKLGPDEVQKLLDGMEKETLAIKRNALEMGWHMRGSVSYVDALNMSSDERELMSKIIDDHIETTKNTKLPYF